jgi:hypothetical protein
MAPFPQLCGGRIPRLLEAFGRSVATERVVVRR